MEPASSNPPEQPIVTQPQEIPVVPPVNPVAPVNPVPPVASTEIPPAPVKPGSSKTMIIIAIAILVIAVLAAAAYFLGFLTLGGGSKSQTSTQVPVITPIESPVSTVSAIPVASPSATTQGMATGKLCYPAESAPPGDITAKETTSGKIFTQKFAGTAAGGSLTYTFPLDPGTYHLKYQTAPTMAGYYTACAKDPTSVTCAQDSNHVNLDVVVAAGKTVTGVDICDFYWNQTQKQSLDSTF